MIGRLKCWWKKKHVRGKYLRAEDNGRTKVFACPRCKRETSYKAKAATGKTSDAIRWAIKTAAK